MGAERYTVIPMIIPPGYALWLMTYRFEGDSEEMIATCGVDVGEWGGDFINGVDWLHSEWNDVINASLGDTVTYGPDRLVVGQDGGDPLTYSGALSDVGAVSAFPMWPNSAVLIQKRTAVGGRRNRGRFYQPGFSIRNQITAAGVIDPDYLFDLQTNIDLFMTHVNAGTGFQSTDLVVLHSSAPSTPAVITSLTADSKVATQRRRLRP